MKNTNLITAANVARMKFHVANMVSFPGGFASIERVEQIMDLFDYESEETETIVFIHILQGREIGYPQ